MSFTSKQITTMVVVLCAAVVLVPVGAYAVGSAVNIVDAATGAKARVSSTGQLYTVNVDPGTGARSKVDGAGKQLVGDGSSALTIDGAISATAPAKPLFATGALLAAQSKFHKWGAGRTAVTDVILWQSNSSGVRASIPIQIYADGGGGNCETVGSVVADLGFYELASNAAPLVVNLTTPAVATTSAVACLWIAAPNVSGTFVRYTFSGFDV